MAGVWIQRALRTVAPAGNAGSFAFRSVVPRAAGVRCMSEMSSPSPPSLEEDPLMQESGAREGPLTEVLRRMLSMDNASQKEKNKLLLRQALIDHQRHEADTGSPEAQIAIWSERITYLTAHMKQHRKDNGTKRGLMQLVADRRKMLKYLKRKDEGRYFALIEKLGLRDVINLTQPMAFLPTEVRAENERKQRNKAQEKENLEKGISKNARAQIAYNAKKKKKEQLAQLEASILAKF